MHGLSTLRRLNDQTVKNNECRADLTTIGYGIHIPEKVYENSGESYDVWLNTEVADFDGLVIGVGNTKKEALQNAEDHLTLILAAVKRLGALIGMFLLVLGVESAHAEPKIDIPTSIWVTSVAADYWTTYQNMDYFTEKNPLLGWLDHEPAQMIALGAAIDTGTYFLWKDITKNHKKIQKVGLIAAAGFRTYLAIRNRRAYNRVNEHFHKRTGR